jgi:hypothetical protein
MGGDPNVEAMAAMNQLNNQQGAPLGLVAPPMQASQQQEGYLDQAGIQEIYGLLAQGNDPSGAGSGYVSAMQRQQVADRQNAPMAQWLELYGNINPYDFTSASLDKFHKNTIATGQLEFGMLERVEDLSNKEQGYLNDAIKKAQASEVSLGRMSNMADRFQKEAPNMRAGLVGRLDEWMTSIAGTEGDVQALRTEYEQVKNKLVVEGLPPGVASDTDIAIAMRGWPSATANPAMVAAFLRGASKIEAISYAQASHEAQFLSRNKTQQGQLDEWSRLRDTRALEAMRRFGGLSVPKNADGSPMSPEDAAQLQYGTPQVSGKPPPLLQRGQQAAAAVEEAAGGLVPLKDLMENY